MQTKFYKLIFDISFCYSIGAFLLRFLASITVNGVGLLSLVIAALVTTLLKQKRLIRIGVNLLLPGAFLLTSLPKLPELIVYLLIWGYYFYISMTGRYNIKRGDFVDLLKRIFISWLFLSFLMLASVSKFISSIRDASPYLIAVLISAVFLLRHLRTDNQMEQMKRYQWQQLFEMLAFLVISLMLTFARAPQNLVEGLLVIYQHLLAPILSLLVGIIGMLVGGIIYLIYVVINILTKKNKIVEFDIKPDNVMRPILNITDTGAGGGDWVVRILYPIGIIVGLVLLFFFFRWLMGERMKQGIPEGVLETRESLVDIGKDAKSFSNRRPKDPRGLVRYYYTKCLQWMQHKKMDLRPQDTTDEIDYKYCNFQGRNLEVHREESAELKQRYRKARYQLTVEVTKEDVMKVKELYQKICKNKK